MCCVYQVVNGERVTCTMTIASTGYPLATSAHRIEFLKPRHFFFSGEDIFFHSFEHCFCMAEYCSCDKVPPPFAPELCTWRRSLWNTFHADMRRRRLVAASKTRVLRLCLHWKPFFLPKDLCMFATATRVGRHSSMTMDLRKACSVFRVASTEHSAAASGALLFPRNLENWFWCWPCRFSTGSVPKGQNVAMSWSMFWTLWIKITLSSWHSSFIFADCRRGLPKAASTQSGQAFKVSRKLDHVSTKLMWSQVARENNLRGKHSLVRQNRRQVSVRAKTNNSKQVWNIEASRHVAQ